MGKKIVIIGGVAGGASAATRARRVNSEAEIIIYEKGPKVSFANCGLPYHLGGEIKDRSSLLVASEELFRQRFNIQVRTLCEVTEVDAQLQMVTVKDLSTGQSFQQPYDKLILSTGSELIKVPEIPMDASNAFSLWSLDDLDRIISYLSASARIKPLSSSSIAVIGAGFVGLEVVEQLSHLGIKVHLIERATQVLGPLDPEIARFIEEELVNKDISLHLGTTISEVIRDLENKVNRIVLGNGESIDVDCLIAGIGVRPLTLLATMAGLEIGSSGAVKVNENYQTSINSIYAVGDMAEDIYGPTNQPTCIPLAGPANRAGRIAGEHAAHERSQFNQKVYGTSIVRVFSKAAGLTGLSEKLCTRLNIEYRVAFISASHHAGYFPGAKELIIKLLYAPNSGKILGAQVIGEEGVDKRIDIVATLLHFGGSVRDLASLDLAYAPPFGSAKDPLHQAAFVALNDLDSRPALLHPGSLLEGFQVVDVRSEGERDRLPLPGAVVIPIDQKESPIAERIKNLDPGKPTVVVCHSGKRAHIVASLLQGNGFTDVKNLTGGMMIRSRTL